MLIRSQDRKDIIIMENSKRISADKIFGKDKTDWVIEINHQLPIGIYSTEAKAIKVLDMISDEYLKRYFGQGGQMATSSAVFQPFGFIPPKVFQMPSDEEVEV